MMVRDGAGRDARGWGLMGAEGAPSPAVQAARTTGSMDLVDAAYTRRFHWSTIVICYLCGACRSRVGGRPLGAGVGAERLAGAGAWEGRRQQGVVSVGALEPWRRMRRRGLCLETPKLSISLLPSNRKPCL